MAQIPVAQDRKRPDVCVIEVCVCVCVCMCVHVCVGGEWVGGYVHERGGGGVKFYNKRKHLVYHPLPISPPAWWHYW